MRVVTTVEALKQALADERQSGKTIGLVPTMGALHEGHASLVRRSVSENGCTVVSVFVNPTQFNDKNDLANYPRTLDADCALLERLGASLVFAPSVEEVYPEPDTRTFSYPPIDSVMEGPRRPGHFNGVCQIVSKLFLMVEPDRAYFGEKDFQQIAVIKAMVKQLGLDVEIVECPIIRDVDGLALSSRNTLLTPEYRAAAPHIYEVISQCAAKSKELSPAELTEWVIEQVEADGLLKVIYFQAVDATTLQQVTSWDESPRIQGCIAVQAGEIRLIDNVKIK